MHVKIRLDLHITSFLGAAAHRCLADFYAQFDKLNFNSALEAVSIICVGSHAVMAYLLCTFSSYALQHFVSSRPLRVRISRALPH